MSDSPATRRSAVNPPADLPSGLPDDHLRFADRHDAGRRLATLLERFRDQDPVVIGIPRGGVPVAAEIARALSAQLDVVVARKVGAPDNPEYGIGALAEGGASVLDEDAVRALGIGPRELDAILDRARDELDERLERFRGAGAALALVGRTVLLVDDGLATGRTAQAAAQALYRRGAARVILAVPVAAASSAQRLGDSVDEVVTAEAPPDMWAIGVWYKDFSPPSDEEVATLIGEHGAPARQLSRDPAAANREA